MKKGIFIAFEGIDGSGKSTQVRRFVDHLFSKNKYYHIVLTRNPYKNLDIRKILREDKNPASESEELAELFIRDRKEMVEEAVIPNLKKGFFVVTDRYKLSTIAYQSAQGLEMEDLINRQKKFPIPDITFIIDSSLQECLKRIKNDKSRANEKEHKFEADSKFLQLVGENYYKLKQKLPEEKIFIINGDRDIETIHKEIIKIFEEEILEKRIFPIS